DSKGCRVDPKFCRVGGFGEHDPRPNRIRRRHRRGLHQHRGTHPFRALCGFKFDRGRQDMNVFGGLMNWWNRLRNFQVPDAARQWFKRARVDLKFFEETHSTNDLAKSEALETPSEITVYIARRQNQGRGRANRRWHDARTDAQLFITWSFE